MAAKGARLEAGVQEGKQWLDSEGARNSSLAAVGCQGLLGTHWGIGSGGIVHCCATRDGTSVLRGKEAEETRRCFVHTDVFLFRFIVRSFY